MDEAEQMIISRLGLDHGDALPIEHAECLRKSHGEIDPYRCERMAGAEVVRHKIVRPGDVDAAGRAHVVTGLDISYSSLESSCGSG